MNKFNIWPLGKLSDEEFAIVMNLVFIYRAFFQLLLPIFSTKMEQTCCMRIMIYFDSLSIYNVMYEDNDYCDAGGAMWDPISDDNLSSLDPFTANQTNQKINKNGNEMK